MRNSHEIFAKNLEEDSSCENLYILVDKGKMYFKGTWWESTDRVSPARDKSPETSFNVYGN